MNRLMFIFLVACLLGGCATTPSKSTVPTLKFTGKTSAIALMPLDVELSLLTASGMQEPRAEWTSTAKQYMNETIRTYLGQHQVNLVDGSDIEEDQLVDLLSLHEVVGQTILYHHYLVQLPTKGAELDWTLGQEANALRDSLHADYALFVFIRDSYASGGHVAMQILAAAAGVGIQGGMQVGFASLVDLRTGKIVWFNRLVSSTGDLREEEPAAKSVAKLLEGFPL